MIQAWANESLRWPNKDETIVRRAAYCQLMDMLSPSYTVLKKGKSKLSRHAYNQNFKTQQAGFKRTDVDKIILMDKSLKGTR